MHGTIAASQPVEKPVEPKQRTITLTNRAPIQIVEDEWPVIAQGMCGDEHPGGADIWSWEIAIRVRQFHKPPTTFRIGDRVVQAPPDYRVGQCIVHAHFKSYEDPDGGQTVRVGRLLETTTQCATYNLWKHIREVGEELRERIDAERMRRLVTHAVDGLLRQAAATEALTKKPPPSQAAALPDPGCQAARGRATRFGLVRPMICSPHLVNAPRRSARRWKGS